MRLCHSVISAIVRRLTWRWLGQDPFQLSGSRKALEELKMKKRWMTRKKALRRIRASSDIDRAQLVLVS